MRIVADEKITLVKEVFSDLGEVIALPSKQIDRNAVKDAEVLLLRTDNPVDGDLLSGTRVRFVASASAGTDQVDFEYLRGANIPFANSPGCNADAVAQYVTAALLRYASRHGLSLRGKSLGVVGVGNIGSRVARIARLLGMRALLNDPPLARQTGEPMFLPLDDLMEADFLTFHVPLTRSGSDRTLHLFDAARLAKMRTESVLINTSRGEVVDSAALRKALSEKRPRGAILDVWANEPDIDCDLLSLVEIGTSHIAGYSWEGKLNGTKMIYEALCRHLNRRPVFEFGAHLPPPRAAQVVVSDDLSDPQEVLSRVVAQSYDLDADDARLRRITDLPRDQRPDYFRTLRSQYPIRRQFEATRVVLPKPHQELKRLLEGIGLRVGVEEKGS